jgi:hypothetical protein
VSEPVKVLPMAQLLRLAREKEAREREANAATAEMHPESPVDPAAATSQETIVGQTIPQQTIVEPAKLEETIVNQTIVKSTKSSRQPKTNDLPETKPAKGPHRNQPPLAGAVDVSKGYYPSYNDLSDRLIPELGLNPFEQSVLQRLYRLSRGWKSDECEVGLGTLSKFCVMSRSQVQRSVAALIEKGLIINLGPAKKGSKDGNRYKVLPGVPTVPLQTIVRQTIVSEERTLSPQNTEVRQTIVTGNTNKNNNKDDLKTHSQTPPSVRVGSKFSLEECRRFAESLRGEGIQNPGGYATAIHRSGEADDRVEAFLKQQDGRGAGKPELDAGQIQEQANFISSLLRDGAAIEELEEQFAQNYRPSQWHMIRSVALAQAKLSGAPAKTKDSKS